ncbi:Squalene/phytoene synthase [Trema orientale]|uniref:Squalene/phytoene synthase n=1 Tax=Trema orientale TaxID=63057 RepID=A0A2P5BT10_TREOI|nr:Squalene/phytoene synthase [Trema orientale]
MFSALCSSLTVPVTTKPRPTRKQSRSLPSFTIFSELSTKQRRSASYHPTIWETKHIESFVTPYNCEYELHSAPLEELKNISRCSLKTTKDSCILLKRIDSIQRLGVAYHFEDEIEEANNKSAVCFGGKKDVFDRFRGQDGRFLDSLSGDVEGLLSLYEASHLGMPGENALEETKNFTIRKLQYFSTVKMDGSLAKLIEQSLRVFEARNFIDIYHMDETKSPTLLELAQLDYNLVQSVYQKELKELASWWRDSGFKENLAFARDRLIENYLCALGIIFEPHLSKCRIGLTKFVWILDIYDDIYGSLDELERFTNAVNRSYLVEARWFSSEYTPSLDEYLENAWTSVGGHAATVQAYIF